MIRVGLFDDHPMTGRGLVEYINAQKPELEVIFIANDKATLLNFLDEVSLDVLIMDIIAPNIEGLELFETVIKNFPDSKIIAYSSLSGLILIENLLSLGVMAYVNKRDHEGVILNAIKSVQNGIIFVPDDVKHLTSKYRTFNTNFLTDRELEVLKLISKEMTSKEIADALFISARTVENHRVSLFHKLEVKNLAGLIIAANRMGYLSE
jgi:DNA-binding NarL/FixJ family response regulator